MENRLELEGLLKALQVPASSDPEFESTHEREWERLCNFCDGIKDITDFSSHANSKLVVQILVILAVNRLAEKKWLLSLDDTKIMTYITATRVLLRDREMKKTLTKAGGVKSLCQILDLLITQYIQGWEGGLTSSLIIEICSALLKLVVEPAMHTELAKCGFPKIIIRMLTGADEIGLLRMTLKCICGFIKTRRNIPLFLIGNTVMDLLNIVDREVHHEPRRLASQVLLYVADVEDGRQQILECDGLLILVSELQCKDPLTLQCIVFTINKLAKNHAPVCDEFLMADGVPCLVDCLRVLNGEDTQYEPVDTAEDARTPPEPVKKFSEEELVDSQRYICTLCSTLSQDDACARALIECGAVYHLAQMIFPPEDANPVLQAKYLERQVMSLVALRLLYSADFQRAAFQRLFGNNLYEWFIDIGNFRKDHKYYAAICANLRGLKTEERMAMKQQLATEEEGNERVLAEYTVLDELGSGSFGTVLRVVDKKNELYALKELHFRRDAGKFGSSDEEKRKVVKEYITEVGVVSAELCHDNVVHYYKAFQKGDNLYVVMNLIDGTTLGRAILVMREKGEHFDNDRLARIIAQLATALYYVHKTKRMIHRDIKPANVMLGRQDHVTLTDFGLAQCKPTDSSLMSTAVGTLMYQSPEVMKSEPYSDKADIWAVGCVVYQMVVQEPPFSHQNNFILMQKIEAADYKPIPEGLCSEVVINLVKKCLQPVQNDRIDVVQLGGQIPEAFLKWTNEKVARNYELDKFVKREHESNAYLARSKAETAVQLRWCQSENRQIAAVNEVYEKKIQALESALASQTQSAASPFDSPQSVSRSQTPQTSHSRTPSHGSADSVFTSPTKLIPEHGYFAGLYGAGASLNADFPRGSSIHRRQSLMSAPPRSPSAGSMTSSGTAVSNSPMLERPSSRPKSVSLNQSLDVVYIPRERPLPPTCAGVEKMCLLNRMGAIHDLSHSEGLDVPLRIVNRFHQALRQADSIYTVMEELGKLERMSRDFIDLKRIAKRKDKRKLKATHQLNALKSKPHGKDLPAKASSVTYADLREMMDKLLPDSYASEINPPEASSKDGKRVRKKHVAAHGVVSKLPPISDA